MGLVPNAPPEIDPVTMQVRVAYGEVPTSIKDRPYGVYNRLARSVVTEGTEFLAGLLALNTPAGASGKARQAVVTDVAVTPLGAEGHIDYAEPASGYIMFADQGTRPHFPPYEPIAYWASRVLGTTDPKVVGAIRGAIGRRGTKAQRFVERTAVENEHQAVAVMRGAAERAAARINRGEGA